MAILFPEAQAPGQAPPRHIEDRQPETDRHQDTVAEVHQPRQGAAVRRHTTEVHLTTAEARLQAAVTAEEVHTHPEVHHTAVEVHRRQAVATAEAEVHQAEDIEDNKPTITS